MTLGLKVTIKFREDSPLGDTEVVLRNVTSILYDNAGEDDSEIVFGSKLHHNNYIIYDVNWIKEVSMEHEKEMAKSF